MALTKTFRAPTCSPTTRISTAVFRAVVLQKQAVAVTKLNIFFNQLSIGQNQWPENPTDRPHKLAVRYTLNISIDDAGTVFAVSRVALWTPATARPRDSESDHSLLACAAKCSKIMLKRRSCEMPGPACGGRLHLLRRVLHRRAYASEPVRPFGFLPKESLLDCGNTQASYIVFLAKRFRFIGMDCCGTACERCSSLNRLNGRHTLIIFCETNSN